MQHLNWAYKTKLISWSKSGGGPKYSLSPGGKKVGGTCPPRPPPNYAHETWHLPLFTSAGAVRGPEPSGKQWKQSNDSNDMSINNNCVTACLTFSSLYFSPQIVCWFDTAAETLNMNFIQRFCALLLVIMLMWTAVLCQSNFFGF